jgi:8-oxo-dGTP diphosphatase
MHLVRHAKAGSRRAWDGDDSERPLSKAGRAQAAALRKTFAQAGVTRVLSSPYVRCRQTVEPFAERAGIEVEITDELAEGASLESSLGLVDKVAGDDVALCTHGDVIANLLMHYSHLGVDLGDDRLEKASVWSFEVVDGQVRSASYLPPRN